MSLRQIAELDLGLILEDSVTGFGYSIVLTDPSGKVRPFTGFSDDISQIIDPDTGEAVSGRLASVAIRTSSLYAAGLSLPVGISDAGSKPWIVEFDDINGTACKFKVSQSNPDRALGLITLLLELYK